ncbi:hypothetical protein QQ045_020447 [Rhodiola kirilowii]
MVALPGRFDVATVALHEIGHLLGLGHSSVQNAIMFPSIAANTVKGLAADDINDSNRDEIKLFWKKFWRVKAQLMVKNFMWRVYHNVLPTTGSLINRGCQIDQVSRIYGRANEHLDHVLLECDWAQGFWKELLNKNKVLVSYTRDPGDWV